MPEQPDRNLRGPRYRGARVIRPAAPAPPPPSRRQRFVALFSRTRVIVATAIAVVVGATGLLSSTLDLWGRARGGEDRPGGSIDIGYQTAGPGERVLWDASLTRCENPLPAPGPDLFLPEYPGDDLAAGPGEVGVDHDQRQVFTTSPLVHPDVIDVDPDGFSREQFVELGAVVADAQEIRVALANRTDEELVITDLTLDVERHPAPAGTMLITPGGDPFALYTISFDLNEDEPVARAIDDDCVHSEPFFARYAFAVDAGAAEIFGVQVTPGDCLCLVRLTVEYWHRGRWQTLTVPEAGADPIPVATVSTERYGMVYVEQPALTPTGEEWVLDKHDCRREEFELCQWPAPPG